MAGMFTAYNKVRKCIASSTSIAHLDASRKMIEFFVTAYDVDIKFMNRLMRALLLRKEEIVEEYIDE